MLQGVVPKPGLKSGTSHRGTLFLLCRVSPPGAQTISVDLGERPFGGCYAQRKILLYREFPGNSWKLCLIRADSHLAEPKNPLLSAARRQIRLFVQRWRSHVSGRKGRFREVLAIAAARKLAAMHDVAEAGLRGGYVLE